MSSKLLWKPSEQQIKESLIHTFTCQAEKKFNRKFIDYEALHLWSIQHPEEFWSFMWEFSKTIATDYEKVINDPFKLPGAKWFEGAKLNYAENCLKYEDDCEAIVAYSEARDVIRLSYKNLKSQVAILAAALRADGVKSGDYIVGILTNIPEAIIAMLACSSIGAVWSACSPDFGATGILDRFSQLKPKILFAVDGYNYNGQQYDISEKLSEITKKLPSLEKVIIIPISNQEVKLTIKVVDYSDYQRDLLSLPKYESLSYDHPLYVLFTSGTTGVPKGIIHSAGGSLIQHLKEHQLHCNLQRTDVLFYYTTCSWMMWNWLVSGLATGCKLILYDGAPMYPNVDVLIDLIQKEKISVFGTSATYLVALEKALVKPIKTHNLNTLRTILSTGSTLSAESFEYVYRDIKQNVCLSSTSGGTDIVSCFVLGNPSLPVYSGEIQCKGLGMAIDIFDENGKSIIEASGELVCKQSAPCMPVAFLDDTKGEKYLKAYFNKFPSVWAHGVYAKITDRGTIVMYGRSDATLKRAGVRIGTAEIYRIVQKFIEVLDYAAVEIEIKKQSQIILFLKLRDSLKLDLDLKQKISSSLRSEASPRHVPDQIFQVSDIPKTRNGKTAELAIREVLSGRIVNNKAALANPEVLDEFSKLSSSFK